MSTFVSSEVSMAERPKIHVFLGAPPPPSDPGSEPEAGVGPEDRPLAGWRHLELTWREGRLRPSAGETLVSFRDVSKCLCRQVGLL